MHDPLTLVGTVPGPWLRRDYRGRLRLGKMVDIWHHDPSGYDSDTCRGKRWRWHVHHWRFRLLPFFKAKRWLTTRCAWCNGPHRKGDPVNVSHSWGEKPRWWQRERHLFHSECSSVASAHKSCTCQVGPWEFSLGGSLYGTCAACKKYRGWREKDDTSPKRLTDAMFASVPAGQRPTRDQLDLAARLWHEYRSTEGKP